MSANNTNIDRLDRNGSVFYYALTGAILILLAFIVIYPLYFIIIASISDPDAVLAGRVYLYPEKITLSGFSKILNVSTVWKGYLNTIIYTVLTVIISLLVTITAGWSLSRKNLPFRKFFMVYFIIPMFFGGRHPCRNVISKHLFLEEIVCKELLPNLLLKVLKQPF